MQSGFRFFVLILTAIFLSLPAFAQDDDGELVLDLINARDFKTLSGANARLAPHGNDLMGDMIDKNTGAITFQHTDISIPGNSNLEVALRRKRSQGNPRSTPFQHGFGDWVLDVPIVHIAFGYPLNTLPLPEFNNGCLNNLGAMGRNLSVGNARASTNISPDSHVSGSILYVPGKGVSGRPDDPKEISDLKSDWKYGGRTTDHAGRCATSVIAPDGTKYKFGRHAFRLASDMEIPVLTPTRCLTNAACVYDDEIIPLRRKYAVYLVTEVEDIHGNWVRYDYTNNSRAELTRIYSDDGRDIRLHYESAIPDSNYRNSRRVSHITANGRQWNYEYASAPTNVKPLYKVHLPDGRYWRFGTGVSGMYIIGVEPHQRWTCLPWDRSFDLKHPDGAIGTFRLRETRHIKGATNPGASSGDDYLTHYMRSMDIPHITDDSLCSGTHVPDNAGRWPWHKPDGWPIYRTISIKSKTISGTGIPTATWDFEYRDYDGGNLDYNWTKVTGPDGTQRTYSYRAVGEDFGLLKSIDVNSANGETESITYEHDPGKYTYCRADSFGNNNTPENCKIYSKRPITKTTHQRDGDSYTTEMSYDKNGDDFVDYGLPNTITNYSNVSLAHSDPDLHERITDTTYEHNTSKWILGLPKTVTQNGRLLRTNTYDPVTGQLNSTKKYNAAYNDKSYTYNADGTVNTVTDALGRVTKAASWKRGIPRTVYKAFGSSDEITLSRTVDNNGWIMSQTDAKGYRTAYARDNMGRLTLIDPWGNWTNTDIDYDFSGGGAVQTITKGDSETQITYDGMFRPVLERSKDLSGNWESYINTEYDTLGRVSFKSHPSNIATSPIGFDFAYDGLGRATTQAETVAPFAATTTSFHSGHRKRVTDPEGHYTDYYTDGFGDPIKIIQSLNGGTGTTTELIRNEWGEIEQSRQHGNTGGFNMDESQYYTYDDQRRICRHQKPETNDTLYGYDAAGQMITKAEAISSLHEGCDPYSGNKLVTYHYDDLGRTTLTDYFIAESHTLSGTADTYNNYDDNGNLLETRRSEGANAITRTYTYNTLNKLTSENLSLEGESFNLAYSYDPDGYLTSRTYPTGRVVSYNNDGLGRPDTISNSGTDYASNISYYPSGATQSLTYGNNMIFNQTLNNRLLPQHLLTQNGGDTALDLIYDYDGRGKVTSVLDGTATANDRTYDYDGMGRLISADGPWGSGSYVYDALGNLRSKTLGARSVTNNYDSNNRIIGTIDSASGPRMVLHNGRGGVNLLGDLEFRITKSNRIKTVLDPNGQIASYRYDGHYRRVKSDMDAAELYTMYDAAGAMVHRYNKTTGEETDYVAGPGNTTIRVKHGAGAGIPTYLHKDHLGSASAGTDGTGNLLWTEQYTPFGEKHLADAANDNHPGFTGHVYDSATGLTYMQARYFDPGIGRFLSIDPVTFNGSNNPAFFNRYAYTFNDPVNLIDSTGMAPDQTNSHTTFQLSPKAAATGRRIESANTAISFVRASTGVSNNVSITYKDTYASLSNVIGVVQTDAKDETFNGTATPIDGVTQNSGTAVSIFRSAVEPTGENRAFREVGADGNVEFVNTNDQLTGTENAVRVLGHEVAGHVQGGLGTSQIDEAKADQAGERVLREFRDENQ